MKKYIIATLAAVAVFAGAAFAASLDVNAGTLQAGSGTIGECVSGEVKISYDNPEPTEDGRWLVDGITLTPDAGSTCEGLTFSVVVTGGIDSDIWMTSTQSGTFGSGAASVTFVEPFDARQAGDVHLVIRNASS